MEDVKGARWSLIAITVLRVLVGWHFLYEGLSKLTSPSWSAAGYMKQARGPFAEMFRSIAAQPNLLANADLITMWGLTLVGLCLILGLFTRLASLGGMPLAIFWLGGQRNDAVQTRSNLLTYFALSTLISGTALALAGVLTRDIALRALALLVPYGLGILVGTRAFWLASERTFRRMAYLVIAASALLALPLFDAWLR